MAKSLALVRPAPSEPVEFRSVFEAEFGYVLRTLRFLGVRGTEAEDVAHDVFLHVYRHFASYDSSRPLRPWLFAFIFRAARDFRALARNRQPVLDLAESVVDPAPLPDAQLYRSELQDLALEALQTLDEDERAVFVAHDLDDLAAPEIAAALGIPLNTVYSRLRRARTKFETAARRLSAGGRAR